MQFLQKQKVPLGLGVALLFIVANTIVSYRSVERVIASNTGVMHTYEVLNGLQQLFSTLKDVETGQRGYIITGEESYLEPHLQAVERVEEQFDRLDKIMEESASRHYLPPLREHIEKRIAISRKTIALRRRGDFNGARAVISSGVGKAEMNEIRSIIGSIETIKTRLLQEQAIAAAKNSSSARLTLSVAALLNLLLLGLVYYMIARDIGTRQKSAAILAERARLASLSAEVGLLLTRNEGLHEVLQHCAEAIVTHLDVAFARIWTLNEAAGVLEMQASAGMYTHLDGPHGRVPLGEFKIGRIAQSRKPHLTNQVVGDPEVSEQEWAQREGMVAFAGYPMIVDERLVGVIAVFARSPLADHALKSLGTVADAVALGIQRKQSELELRESEARKSSILETALDCVIGIDHESHIVEWNPAAEKTFGYTREEAIGRDLAELIIPESLRDAHRTGLKRYLKTGETVLLNQRIEVTALRRDGEEFPVEVAITRIQSEGAPFFTAYLRDITSRRQSELDLQRARDTAETANKTKSLFLANMSHELRTPLNAILGYSEMLHEEALEEGLKTFGEDLDKINTAGKHLLTLINDILDLSKIEAGKMELYLEEFDVADVVNELAATVRPLMENKHTTLQIECDANLGEMRADLTKVRQSLLNLLSNAAKFTHEGTVIVEAKRESMDNRDWISLCVRDTGIGMSAEQLVKLFRPFTQADASTTRKFGGTGLGLALTRRFCQMMGGDVTVSSTPGEGSTFTLKIPAVVEVAGDGRDDAAASALDDDFLENAFQQLAHPHVNIVSEAQPALADEVLPLGENPEPAYPEPGTAILVIDDDPVQCELMQRFLIHEGFSVVTARGGEEGLALARRILPTAITLDVMMPDMDGWSVLTAIKNDPELHDIPVIMLTMVDDKNKGYALGAADYLTKPINRSRLGQLLQKYRCLEPPCPVLIVEDDATMRGMISKMLTSAGWRAREAANGREALQSIERNRPALILLDLMMPEMDGFEFAAAVRHHESWRNIPIIVLTAKELTTDDRLRLNGYVQKVLQKTAHSRDELMHQVRDLINASTGSEPKALDENSQEENR